MPRRNRPAFLLALLFTALTALSLAVGPAAAQEPLIDLGDSFDDEIDNPYFPLIPGTRYYYEGDDGGTPISDVIVVLHRTKEILGVTCVVVRDRAYEDGILVEDTYDWFAQDLDGNVWYFGEDSSDLDPDGNVISKDGSWEAGVDGALPGIIMKADPQVGDQYQQEDAPGIAEDMAKVLSLTQKVRVPFGRFKKCLQTKEYTPLEPGVVEHKFYARGIGFIRSEGVKGSDEVLELVEVEFEDDEEEEDD